MSKKKLLLDEMYSGFKDHFKILGWDAITVKDIDLNGSDDYEIAGYAHENGYVLVTGDKKKPVEYLDLLGGMYVLVDTPMMVRMIVEAVEEKYGPRPT